MSSSEIDFINPNKENSTLKRTSFFTSVGWLTLQVLIPGALLFFLTSKDFSFSFFLSLSLMIIVAIGFLLFSIVVTFITYKFKLHGLDQFTYVLPFAFFIIGFYLSGYWLDYNYFLIRFIISFACSVVGVFLASAVLLLFIREKALKSL